MLKQTIKVLVLVTLILSNVYAYTAVEDALLNDTEYTISGTFGKHNFPDADVAFDWAFTTNKGVSYQLQGKPPSENDLFGWEEVNIATPDPAWHMFQLHGDIDGDGTIKFDWILASTNMSQKALYKLAGVSDSGNFEYSSALNIDYQVIGNTIQTGGGGDGSNDGSLKLECSANASFTPTNLPVVSNATPPAVATVIALHGKNGSPISNLQILADDLNQKGYDVILPYMPWSDSDESTWDGTLCDSISYINELVSTEQAKGNSVILLGYSLAAPIVLAYSALENTLKPEATVLVAPGHFIHHSTVLADAHASSIEKANNMIENNQAAQYDSFEVYGLGVTKTINTTPEIYLSFHDTSKFPNIESSIPLTHTDVLWLAGSTDSLTLTATKFGITNLVQNSSQYTYKVIDGNHYTLIDNVADELNTWYSSLE